MELKLASMIVEVFEPVGDDVPSKVDSETVEAPMVEIPLSSVYVTALAAIKLNKHDVAAVQEGEARESSNLFARVLAFLGCEGGLAN